MYDEKIEKHNEFEIINGKFTVIEVTKTIKTFATQKDYEDFIDENGKNFKFAW